MFTTHGSGLGGLLPRYHDQQWELPGMGSSAAKGPILSVYRLNFMISADKQEVYGLSPEGTLSFECKSQTL